MDKRTEYRITGRFRNANKRHVVDKNAKWSLIDAQVRLQELEMISEREMKYKKRNLTYCGEVGIAMEYYSDYDLLELRIESREVTPWSVVE